MIVCRASKQRTKKQHSIQHAAAVAETKPHRFMKMQEAHKWVDKDLWESNPHPHWGRRFLDEESDIFDEDFLYKRESGQRKHRARSSTPDQSA